MIRLRYGNTNTFYLPGRDGGLLVDTDYAGTLQSFYRAIKSAGIRVSDIAWVMATHWHPDHAGLIGELMDQGVRLLLPDVQKGRTGYPGSIFDRDRLPYVPVDESKAEVIPCGRSREFLARLGIGGELVRTPSHSPDSVSLILDNGDCLVGDLSPLEYLAAYEENGPLKRDWDLLLSFRPRRVFYAHQPVRLMDGTEGTAD